MSTPVEECHAAMVKAQDECSSNTRFEAWADLYYQRFGRMAPGKSEPMEARRNSCDEENSAQCAAWHTTGLAKLDAIIEVVRLREQVETLQAEIEELTP